MSELRHLSDEDLIGHLYGIEVADEHLHACGACRGRLAAMTGRRELVEAEYSAASEIPTELLAAQRRQVYRSLEQRRWFQVATYRRLASAVAAVLVLAGGFAALENTHHMQAPLDDPKVSDAQLAAEVSQIAGAAEPVSTAPMQALFEE